MAGLQRIAEDIGLPCAKVEGGSSTGSGSSSNGEDVFKSENMTTVIVPALGGGMAETYANGQIKLLAINVCVPNFWRLSHSKLCLHNSVIRSSPDS